MKLTKSVLLALTRHGRKNAAAVSTTVSLDNRCVVISQQRFIQTTSVKNIHIDSSHSNNTDSNTSNLEKPHVHHHHEQSGGENTKPTLTLLDKYHQLVKSKILTYDPRQFEIVLQLSYFHSKAATYKAEILIDESMSTATNLTAMLKRFFGASSDKIEYEDENGKAFRVKPKVKSVYLYGGVGCGKTMLMDLVYTMLPKNSLKQRIHFNKFMLNVHAKIHDVKRTEEYKDADPIEVVATQLLSHTHLLFFDEFQVTDIADAMLMSRLFTHLFSRGLVVFFTSNRPPSDLYKNGLQRELFMPFIEQIHHYCDVLCLDSPVDYRKRAHISTNRVYFNCDYETDLLDNMVRDVIKQQDGLVNLRYSGKDELVKLEPREIDVLGRKVVLNRTYKRLLDTTFGFLCEEARSSVDYLELVKHFDIIVVREIPFISLRYFDVLRRFIVLIDTLYDNRVKLLCSGKASSPQLLFDFESINSEEDEDEDEDESTDPQLSGAVHDEHFALDRTISRLIDMQSENYHKNSAFVSSLNSNKDNVVP